MIQTPLGIIEVKKDGKKVECTIKRVKMDKQCSELNGRFAILVDYIPDGQAHTIACCIKGYRKSKDDFIESEERADIKSFCKGARKVSIGIFSDIPIKWGKSPGEEMDYWTESLKNGMKYYIRPNAQCAKYPFGVAWIENFNDDNEIQTWYGADPTIWWSEIKEKEHFLFCCVKQEIDQWDPYDFFPDAPSNEYDSESRRIVEKITVDSYADEIAEVVAEVFSKSFGEDEGFTVDYCENIAGKIKRRIEKYKDKLKHEKFSDLEQPETFIRK